MLTEACEHYETSAPTVHDYLDGLYIRISTKPSDVRLSEMLFVETLIEDGHWMQANYAANRVYKLMHRLGMDTTGHAGF